MGSVLDFILFLFLACVSDGGNCEGAERNSWKDLFWKTYFFPTQDEQGTLNYLSPEFNPTSFPRQLEQAPVPLEALDTFKLLF